MTHTLLITRPERQAARFAALCEDRFGDRIDIVTSPLIRIEALSDPGSMAGYGGVIFTSENAIAAVGPAAAGNAMRAYCVGDRTAEVARAAGYDAIAAEGDADHLFDLILRQHVTPPLLHLRGEHARGALAERLTQAGVKTDEAIVYRQIAQPLTEAARAVLRGDKPVILPLFSPRTASLFREGAAGCTAPLRIVVFSPAVADALGGEFGDDIAVCQSPDVNEMLDMLARLIDAWWAVEDRGGAG
ncbi:uroporphyrinogen-III synthase [Aliiroseovarius sp. YM-037]|uniref:uroporphyrinogen-III synthase n=1 Tax=Aliiroseovarius sp. YM-037 TaxID=3341728 RepID=UPI003A80A9DF